MSRVSNTSWMCYNDTQLQYLYTTAGTDLSNSSYLSNSRAMWYNTRALNHYDTNSYTYGKTWCKPVSAGGNFSSH